MNRINVIGTSGSGKTTFSKQLAASLGYTYIEMDALFWQQNWVHKERAVFQADLEKQLSENACWVLDGDYLSSEHLKWQYADTVIWLDYPLIRTMWRLMKRSRSISKEVLWGQTGTEESFRRTFFSKDSVILWGLRKYKSNKKHYQALMIDKRYTHIEFIHLPSPHVSNAFLAGLKTPH